MKKVYTVEISGTTVRVCATRILAEKYVQCMLEETDPVTGQPEFHDWEFYIGEVVFDEK